MRLFHLVCTALAICFFAVIPAQAAKIPIPVLWGTSEKVVKAAELPQSEQYRLQDGTHVDIGYKYKVFEIFYVPLWDYEHTLVGHVGSDDSYLGLPAAELESLASAAGVTIPASPPVPFWDH